MNEKILKLIDRIGLYDTPKFLGVSVYKVFHMINGVENLTRRNKIDFIRDMSRKIGGITLTHINKDPIFFKQLKNEIHYIGFIGINLVIVDIFEDDTYMTDYSLQYSELSDDIIDEIFDTIVKIYEKFK